MGGSGSWCFGSHDAPRDNDPSTAGSDEANGSGSLSQRSAAAQLEPGGYQGAAAREKRLPGPVAAGRGVEEGVAGGTATLLGRWDGPEIISRRYGAW